MKLLLTYSKRKGGEPIIARIVKETGVLITVERANIDTLAGEVLIDVPDESARMICDLIKSRGAEVRILEQGIVRDENECVDCGACISICPKDVFYMDHEWKVQLRKGRCILCGRCIVACPHRALSQSQ
ncbi:MAG: 4Fe-4S binding protein [Methanomicrobiales archaeon]|nr:4Fe-4S binding protein [Methanomicrobiales archaeon]